MSIVRQFQLLMFGLCGLIIILSGGMAYADETEEHVPFAWLFTDNFSTKYDSESDSEVNYDSYRWERRAESAVGSSVHFEGWLGSLVDVFDRGKQAYDKFGEPCTVVKVGPFSIKVKGRPTGSLNNIGGEIRGSVSSSDRTSKNCIRFND